MRGKLFSFQLGHDAVRIIPAHAGQTFARRRAACSGTDHPRTCGANRKMMCMVGFSFGSSPRMRGKPGRRPRSWRCYRIIPAHAGQTSISHAMTRHWTDHPRTCGANMLPLSPSWTSFGSSPHMRGKHVGVRGHRDGRRIIPAHAGQTCCRLRGMYMYPDHPRTCGANSFCVLVRVVSCGSSPHMRGKHGLRGIVRGELRIIPAHAGQTCCIFETARTWADHPRTCGANRLSLNICTRRSGSSPHMRGKQPSGTHVKCVRGSSPHMRGKRCPV